MAADLAPAGRGLLAAPARLLGSRYRAARRALGELWQRSTKPGRREALEIVEKAHGCARRWAEVSGAELPRVPSGLADAVRQHSDVSRLVEELADLLVDHDLDECSHRDLVQRIDRLIGDRPTLHRLPRVAELERQLVDAGVVELLEVVRGGSLVSSELVDAFDRAWLSSVHREILLKDSRLPGFAGELQRRNVEEFRGDDVSHLMSSPARVRRRVAEHAIEIRNRYAEQNDLIRKEASKKTRHLPLRRLFERAPDVLTAVRPCWTMSPLDVAQTLPPRLLFDLVIFDEASQVLPCDAIPALLRAPRVMVAGDSRQLPPTTFFDGTADDEDDPEDEIGSLSDYESILDVMDSMLSRRSLTWHYRSADERLISFSNRNIYDGSLTTFPGADSEGCLDFELVDHRRHEAANTRSNSGEVRRVVDLMIEHALRRPHETLGVIAMGSHHAGRIEAELRRRLGDESSPEFERFFDESLPERTFVKNLERVQGDERDAIILSIGYGKNADGNLLYRFGPLNQAGGERRLNVAVTRARRRMTLVSAFSHAEMDPARSSAEGVRLLRVYMRYAESGGVDLTDADTTEPLNAFEVDVRDKLIAAGLGVVPQYGCSSYRIDFAVRHPDDPGRFVLAVEADGASYHSSRTARDRDRLRQEHLERLGWRFCRIWSTDWFNNHSPEVDRVLEAVREAVREIDAGRPGPHRDGVSEPPSSSFYLTGRNPAIPSDGVPVDGDHTGHGASVEPPAPPLEFIRRDPAPRIPRGLPIDEHDQRLLVQLAQWVKSDGRLRTDEEIFEEMFQQMGYRRRGHRIREALFRAIEQAKRGRQ